MQRPNIYAPSNPIVAVSDQYLWPHPQPARPASQPNSNTQQHSYNLADSEDAHSSATDAQYQSANSTLRPEPQSFPQNRLYQASQPLRPKSAQGQVFDVHGKDAEIAFLKASLLNTELLALSAGWNARSDAFYKSLDDLDKELKEARNIVTNFKAQHDMRGLMNQIQRKTGMGWQQGFEFAQLRSEQAERDKKKRELPLKRHQMLEKHRQAWVAFQKERQYHAYNLQARAYECISEADLAYQDKGQNATRQDFNNLTRYRGECSKYLAAWTNCARRGIQFQLPPRVMNR